MSRGSFVEMHGTMGPIYTDTRRQSLTKRRASGVLSRQPTMNTPVPITQTNCNRQTSLYLSRGPTMHREGKGYQSSMSQQRSSVVPSLNKAPIHYLHREMTRDFTFTGYDIMKDTSPAKVETPDEDIKTHRRRVEMYEAMCKRLGVVPVSFLKNKLSQKEVRLRCHELGPKGGKALSVALLDNYALEVLELAENNLLNQGIMYLSEILDNKIALTELNLSSNGMRTTGCRAVCEALGDTDTLKKLDISANHLKDQDAKYIATLIENNVSITDLRLNHNDFREIGGVHIGNALAQNDTISNLDLSWNHLRAKGAVAIAVGVQNNLGLKCLNLAWNGFAEEGCIAMTFALEQNKFLKELDLTNNRINPDGIGALMKGLQSNDSLVILKLGKNPITPRIALQIIKAIHQLGEQSKLTLLDLEDIVVDEEFIAQLVDKNREKYIEVIHGPVIRKSNEKINIRNPKFAQERNLTTALFEHMDKQGYRVVDMFNRLDKDKNNSLSRDELHQPFKDNDVPVTENQLDELMADLDFDCSGDVDLRELIKASRVNKRKSIMNKLLYAGRKKSPSNAASSLKAFLQKWRTGET